ncbi:MAG: hypothetical protein OHK0056_31170 [Bacteriovoracaceae bacterium]
MNNPEIKVISTHKDDENQIISITFEFIEYALWDHLIHESAVYFKELTGHLPNILVANADTLEILDRELNSKLNSPFNDQKTLDVFQSKNVNLQICLKFELELHQFQLIFDEQASFIHN